MAIAYIALVGLVGRKSTKKGLSLETLGLQQSESADSRSFLFSNNAAWGWVWVQNNERKFVKKVDEKYKIMARIINYGKTSP